MLRAFPLLYWHFYWEVVQSGCLTVGGWVYSISEQCQFEHRFFPEPPTLLGKMSSKRHHFLIFWDLRVKYIVRKGSICTFAQYISICTLPATLLTQSMWMVVLKAAGVPSGWKVTSSFPRKTAQIWGKRKSSDVCLHQFWRGDHLLSYKINDKNLAVFLDS